MLAEPCLNSLSSKLSFASVHLFRNKPNGARNFRGMVAATLPSKPILIYDLGPAPGQCPFVQRSKIVLNEKSIPHHVELIDGQNKPAEFVELFRSITGNPAGRGTVPTIIDGGVKLTESHVVSEYLDTAYPEAGPKLFPTDAQKLALVRLFVELFASEVQPYGFKVLRAESQKDLDEAKVALTHGLTVLDKYLRSHSLKGGDFLLGADFSYAEAAALPFIYRFIKALPHYRDYDPLKIVADNKLDRFEKWIKAGIARPAFKATIAEDEVVVGRLGKFVKPLS